MKKSELAQLQIGSKIENKKSGDVITISNITEIDGKIKYELDNGHALAQATLSKNYSLIQPETVEQVELAIIPVEPEQVEIVETVEPAPDTVEVEIIKPEPDTTVEPKTVEPEPTSEVEVEPVEPETVEPKQVNVDTNNNLANEIFDYFTTQQNIFTLKHNSDHSVIKIGRKKLVEIYVSNTEVTVAVRKELYTEEEQANLDNSRIVKDYAFTLKFKVHSLDEFIKVVNRANDYVPVKK